MTNEPPADPRFPRRPTHPDYLRLTEVVSRLDRQAEAAGAVDVVMAEFADAESVTYMAVQRAKYIARDAEEHQRLASMYLDAFAAGAAFERERAKRDAAEVGGSAGV